MKINLTRLTIFLLIVLFYFTNTFADVFKGKVVNAETGEPLAKATVYFNLTIGQNYNQTGYLETDSLGCYVYYPGWQGKLIFTYSMIGFKSTKKMNYALGPDSNDTINLGEVALRPTELMLEEVKVTAKSPRITMSGDTLVFNPSAFKLKEGARLEELIRKLPGVEKRDNGLYWNNHPLRLVINGRNVFGGDGMIGELPADAAAKLKLYDRKSEESRHMGVDDGKEDHVLDIQVKPGLLDKWYGDVEAEYRTKDHYRGKLNASRLSMKNPQMLFLQANDVNQNVARDASGMTFFDIDKYGRGQFGAYNYEHDWTIEGLGQNYENNHFYVTGSLGHADGWGTTFSTRETFLPEADHTFDISRVKASNHSLAPKLMADLFAYSNKNNSFKATVTATFEKRSSTEETDAAKHLVPSDASAIQDINTLMEAKPGESLYDKIVSRSKYYTSNDVIRRNIEAQFKWTRYYGQKGWSQIASGVTAFGESCNTSYKRNIEYPIGGNRESVRQYAKEQNNNLAPWLRFSGVYNFSSKFFAQMQATAKLTHLYNTRDFYSDNESTETMEHPTHLDQNNSMDYKYNDLNYEMFLYLCYIPAKNLFIAPSVTWTYSHEKGDLWFGALDSTIVRNVNLVNSALNLKWNINRANTLSYVVNYAKFNNTLFYKFNWLDTRNPLLTEEGNPDLKHMQRFNTWLSYNCVWLRKQINMMFYVEYTKEINPMSKLYRYDTSTGAYHVRYLNDKSNDFFTLSVKYDHSINVYWRLQNETTYKWHRNYGYMTQIMDDNVLRTNRQTNNLLRDRLQISYEAEKVKFGTDACIDLYGYRYTDSSYNSNPLSLKYGGWTRLSLSPFEFFVEVSDQYYSGYKVQSMNCHRVVCNASVDYRFYRNKCRLTLAANDIFNKDNHFNYNYTAYERSESWYETLHHYVSLTFTYKFDAKSKK